MARTVKPARQYVTEVRYGSNNTPQHAQPPPLSETATPGEFQRFEDLTRKRAQVPKSEVDEQRQKA